MTKILLTGAGFSHNWSVPLASDLFGHLLSSSEVDDELRRELLKERNQGLGFESTLGRLQEEAAAQPGGRADRAAHALTTALVGIFNGIDLTLKNTQFEFQNDLRYQVGPFLSRFDAIFTLNQDLLLERHYCRQMELLQPSRRFAGAMSPGIGAPPPAPYFDPDLHVSARRSPLPEAEFKLDPLIQPYFKLHGSSHWYDNAGARMLVMGGNKFRAIGGSSLLKWYAQQFETSLRRGGARLMVIGYSFSDPHINRMIIDACRAGLKLFIVDRVGIDVLDKRGPTTRFRPATTELMEVAQPALIGESTRPLSESFGKDRIEHQKLIRFFE